MDPHFPPLIEYSLICYYLESNGTSAHSISVKDSLLDSIMNSSKNIVLMSTYYCQVWC